MDLKTKLTWSDVCDIVTEVRIGLCDFVFLFRYIEDILFIVCCFKWVFHWWLCYWKQAALALWNKRETVQWACVRRTIFHLLYKKKFKHLPLVVAVFIYVWNWSLAWSFFIQFHYTCVHLITHKYAEFHLVTRARFRNFILFSED